VLESVRGFNDFYSKGNEHCDVESLVAGIMFAQLFRARYKFPAFLQTTLFRPRYPPRLHAITTSQALSLPPTVKQNFSAQAEEADRDMDEDGVTEPPEENHSLSPEQGHGYHPSFALGDLLGGQYEVVRKVRVSMLANGCRDLKSINTARLG
jgi:hypothetical protein